MRASAETLGELLAEEFVEFGSSGRTFDKAGIVAALEAEGARHLSLRDFRARQLAPGVVLATYRAIAWPVEDDSERVSLRSSLWVLRGGRWRLLFHQGTPTDGRS